jgi:methylated-DNA-[protein]-cysteine S-methyltransferase
VWRGGLVVGAALPDRSDDNLRRHLSRRFPRAEETEPSGEATAAIRLVVELLGGGKPDLLEIAVDLSQTPPFDRKVYEAARRIPPGEVRSYGDLAAQIGSPGAAQAVGRALGRNPVPIIVPCHRVLAARGGSGGFTAPGGLDTKFRMLEIEGARRSSDPELFPGLPLSVRPSRA